MRLLEKEFKNGFIIDVFFEWEIGLMIGADVVGDRFYFGFSIPFIHVDFSYPIKKLRWKRNTSGIESSNIQS